MQLDLNKFLIDDVINFDENVLFNNDDLNKIGIISIPKCNVKGILNKLEDNLFKIDFVVKGTMVLECDRSLEEVNHNFEIKISKTIDFNTLEEENIKINANILDIFPIIWENIVLEKPSRIVKQNNHGLTSGEGWSLTDELKRENTSQLSELDKLLDMEEKQ